MPADFDITPAGELVLNVPPAPAGYQNGFEGDVSTADGSAIVSGSADIVNNGKPSSPASPTSAAAAATEVPFPAPTVVESSTLKKAVRVFYFLSNLILPKGFNLICVFC